MTRTLSSGFETKTLLTKFLFVYSLSLFPRQMTGPAPNKLYPNSLKASSELVVFLVFDDEPKNKQHYYHYEGCRVT